MTRGRCGSLDLHRTAVSSAPPRRFIPAPLFVSQSDQGIDTGSAARRDVASRQSDKTKEQSHCEERRGIKWANAVKEACEVTGGTEGDQDADDSANNCQSDPLAHNDAQYIGRPRAKRHANADFPRSLGHFVGKQTVESEASE